MPKYRIEAIELFLVRASYVVDADDEAKANRKIEGGRTQREQSEGATRRVAGADYKSIQAAVDAAEPGVEIVVENGTYPAGDCPADCSPCSFAESRWVLSSRMTAWAH